MDRQLLRKMAKAEYKKMMKTRPKNQRLTFVQAFPLIKSMLENGLTNEIMNTETEGAQVMSPEDAALLDGMMEVESPPPETTETVAQIELSPG